MPWRPLPQIVFAIAIYPFQPSSPADLPLELGDELYIIEQGGDDGDWYRGYLVAPPSLLAGLTSVKGQTLEARVFSGIFPRNCVEIREVLGETGNNVAPHVGELVPDQAGDSRTIATGQPHVNGASEDGAGLNGTTNDDGADLALPANGIRHASVKRSKSQKQRPGSSSSRPPTAKKQNDPSLKRGLSIRSTRSQRSQMSAKPWPEPISPRRDPGAPKPAAPVPMLKVGDETPTSIEEPLVDEIASCLREWHSTNLHELLLGREYSLLDKVANIVNTLDLSRRQLLHAVLTNRELESVREKVVWDLVRGNKLLRGEVVVRDPAQRGRVLTGQDSAIEMAKLQSMMSLLDERPKPPVESTTLHHLLVNVRSVIGTSDEPITLVFYLCSKLPGEAPIAISEAHSAQIPAHGLSSSLLPMDFPKTLFTDLSASDIGEKPYGQAELFLVVRVFSSHLVQSSGRSESFGRPSVKDSSQPSAGFGFGDSLKRGRQSLMWGQSYWNRGAQSNPQIAPSGRARQPQPGEMGAGRDRDRSPVRPISKSSGRSQSNPTLVKRSSGIGVLRLGQLMQKSDSVQKKIQILAPQREDVSVKGDSWDDVIPEILQGPYKSFIKSNTVERLQLQVVPFVSADSENLIKSTPTLLQDVPTTKKLGFSGAPTKPRSDIYVTISNAFLARNSFLSHPKTGGAPLNHSSGLSTLQVTLQVFKSSGEQVGNCVFPSSNKPGYTTWKSTVVENGESWNQTVRLALPYDVVSSCHLVMTLAEAPEQPFAIAWIPLWDDDAFLKDGPHSVFLYKYDEMTATPKLTSSEKGGYMSLPWDAQRRDEMLKDEAISNSPATLRIQTFLCSTVFSQEQVLLGLLKWREQSPGEVLDVLRSVVFVPEIEIVKLLNEVFDALFGILTKHAGNDEFEDLIFNALVTVLGIVYDRRFNLGPLVDQYSQERFNYASAAPCLIRAFVRLLSNPTDSTSSRKLRSAFKVGRNIFKFIIRAKEQQKAKEAGIGITSSQPSYSRELQSVFRALEALMKMKTPIVVGSQTLAVQHFPSWLPELARYLTVDETLQIAIDFMDSCVDVKGKLVLHRLIMVVQFSNMEIFLMPEARRTLIVNTTRWLAPYWGRTDSLDDQWREQVRLCCSVLASQVDGLESEAAEYTPKIVESYRALQNEKRVGKKSFSFLFPKSYPFPAKVVKGSPVLDEAMIELSALLAVLSSSPAGFQVSAQKDALPDILLDALHVHLSILNCEAFPSSWISLHIYQHQSTMKTLESIANILFESFLPEPDEAETFNTELWRTFFKTLLKLIGSDALALETYPEQKRRAVWKIAGDVREHGADLLRRSWEAIGWDPTEEDRRRWGLEKIGGFQVQYVPGLVSPIVELCLSVHGGLRTVAVGILRTMIVSEWTLTQDLSGIQAEMIDCLDHLFKTKHINESILQKLFVSEMIDLFEPLSQVPEDPLYISVRELIATIDEFLDLLVAVHSTDITGEASHIIHTLRLMEFLRDMQKEEIYIRYVHQLAQVQLQSRNFTEAALALRLHAEMHEWDSMKIVGPITEPSFPEQSSFERREQIYFEMIRHFEEGRSWDNALAVYKELAEQYESNVFDLAKLARTQRAMAKIYDVIVRGERQQPRYFRVVFRGMGFPVGSRDKQFIYEGAPSEKLSAFTDRLQQQYPSAQILATDEQEDLEGQYLQIYHVSPHRDLYHAVFQRSRVQPQMRDYLLASRPSHFSATSRRHPAGLSVKEQWVEKTLFTTAEVFPTILRRSEIVTVDEVRLSPVQTAIERTIRKTQEALTLDKKVTENAPSNLSALFDLLKGAIDPASTSSVARYRELLTVVPDDVSETEEHEKIDIDPLENALKISMIDYAAALKRALATFAKAGSPHYSAIQEDLSHRFELTFATELASLASPQAAVAVESLPSRVLSISSRDRVPTSPIRPAAQSPVLRGEETADKEARPTRVEKNRLSLSFLKQPPRQPVNDLAELINGTGKDGASSEKASTEREDARRSRSKSTHRRSFLGSGGNGGGSGGGGGDDDQRTLPSRGSTSVGARSTRRSESKDRPVTSSSINTVTSGVGSVRKRLSLLKIGKKNSKANVKVEAVQEE